MEYLHKHMIVDYNSTRCSIYFEEESLVIKSNANLSKVLKEIRYEDIQDVEVHRGLKSTVVVITKSKEKVYLDLYKASSLAMYIETARNGYLNPNAKTSDEENIDFDFTSEEKEKSSSLKPLSEEEITKLERVTALYKAGTISKEQFEFERNLIFKK